MTIDSYGLKVANSTIFHTGDISEIVQRSLTQTKSKYHWHGQLEERKVCILKVTYSNGPHSLASWSRHDNKLVLKLPRKSYMVATSPLIALANATSDLTNEDERYPFFADQSIVKKAAERVARAMGRVGQVDLTDLRLRYCSRLAKGQKEAQNLQILEIELVSLKKEKSNLEENILNYEKRIKDAKAWLEKRQKVSIVSPPRKTEPTAPTFG